MIISSVNLNVAALWSLPMLLQFSSRLVMVECEARGKSSSVNNTPATSVSLRLLMSSKQFSVFTYCAPAESEQPISSDVTVSRDMQTTLFSVMLHS